MRGGRVRRREGIPRPVEAVAVAGRQARGELGVGLLILARGHGVAQVERDADAQEDGEQQDGEQEQALGSCWHGVISNVECEMRMVVGGRGRHGDPRWSLGQPTLDLCSELTSLAVELFDRERDQSVSNERH